MTAAAPSTETILEVAVPVATMWTSTGAPRDVDADAVRDRPDPAAWTAAMDPSTRLDLHGRTLTQLLLGEPVRVLEQDGGWARVAALWQSSSTHADGYPGWVRAAHLGQPVPRTEGTTAFVTATTTRCSLEGGDGIDLSFGTVLWVDVEAEGSVTVLLPDGRRGTLARTDVRLSDTTSPPRYDGPALVDTAARFLGLRYLWGGTSAWGLDCSGLVHLVLRSEGVLLPRDAFDQATHDRVEPVPLGEVRTGDLYFFARPGERVYHVGFVSRPVTDDGTRWMLHAPEGGGLIEDAPLAPHRLETLVAAGRVVG